jgi:hypothetical protein
VIVWIVEDVPLDAKRAARAVVTVAKQKLGNLHESELKLYWNRTIEWDSNPRIERFDSADLNVPEKSVQHQPQIVILDLFFDSHSFRGEDFLRSLRQWELSQPGTPAWVILWSVRTGLKEVDHFLQEEPRRDRRVVSLKTKGDIALIEAVAGCWRSLEEELYP